MTQLSISNHFLSFSEDEDEFAFDNLSHKSSGSSLNTRHKSNNLILTKGQDDLSSTPAARNSSTLPPIKPKRNVNETPTKESSVDEWEAKLYGRNHEIGSTDSLKRRSWDRVPLNAEQEKVKELEATIEEQSMERISLDASVTAPASPSMSEKPLPLPRAATAAEPIVTMNASPNMSPKSIKSEKNEKENIFSKKWKNFKKELTPNKHEKSDEAIKNQYNRSSGGERIIIGGDSFNTQAYIENSTIEFSKELQSNPVKVSESILKKYDGKSKEVK